MHTMDVGHPLAFLRSPVDIEVLRVLAGTTLPLTGRTSALWGIASGFPAVSVLRRLAEHGLVHASEAGRANLHTLNRDHIAVEPLLELIYLRRRLLERLRNDVQALGRPASACVALRLIRPCRRGHGE